MKKLSIAGHDQRTFRKGLWAPSYVSPSFTCGESNLCLNVVKFHNAIPRAGFLSIHIRKLITMPGIYIYIYIYVYIYIYICVCVCIYIIYNASEFLDNISKLSFRIVGLISVIPEPLRIK